MSGPTTDRAADLTHVGVHRSKHLSLNQSWISARSRSLRGELRGLPIRVASSYLHLTGLEPACTPRSTNGERASASIARARVSERSAMVAS